MNDGLVSGGRLQGKVALVVGAGSVGAGMGNGKATAIVFAREGARVVLADVNEEAAEVTAKLIRHDGGDCRTCQADVTKPNDVKRMIAEAVQTYGRLDILHNNVAVVSVGTPEDLSVEDWDKSFAVNLTSVFLACKFALPHMVEQGGGSIINVSSIAATRYLGVPYTAYYATKAALVQFTRAVAIEYAEHGIRANCVLPGFMDTPHVHEFLNEHLGGDSASLVEARGKQTPMKRMGTAWDTANAALFLASDEAGYITATEIVVDGGVSAVSA